MPRAEVLLNLWAKRRIEPPPEVLHPLLFHMLDVAAVTEELWFRCLHSSARRFCSQRLSLSEAEAGKWISFWAGLHDIGKASPVFQIHSEKARHLLEEQGLIFDRFVDDFPHGQTTTYVFPELVGSALPQSGFNRELSYAVGITIGGHHGTFNMAQPGPRQRGNRKWNDVRFDLTRLLADLMGIRSLAMPQHISDTAFYVLVAGLTSVADWIGSNEEFFPYEHMDQMPQQYLTRSRLQAREAVQRVGWAGWYPPSTIAPFRTLFPFIDQPRPLQRKIVELSESLAVSPGLVIIEAPMGEGKTEAAMSLADSWAATLGQKGTYFALPTQATSNQMFRRVKDFLEARYPDSITSLQLIHGGALLSQDFAAIRIRVSQDGEDSDTSSTVAATEWFLPKKRGLLAPFGVGTVDQALLSVLQTRHFFVRLFGLAHKTVIVDEVHAYDTYMSTLLEDLLAWLRALGSSVILLSATLPESKRRDLVCAYGGDPKTLTSTTYPRITWVSGPTTRVHEFEATRHTELHVCHLRDDLDVLVSNLRDAYKDGGCIAIVCNTVNRAQETYNAIKQSGLLSTDELMLLHARYPFEEREMREKAVLQVFGKGSTRKRCAVLVATQIIEQSLDLDFDLMISDLAPADLVLQRAGRIHRHDNLRPPLLDKPTLWIRMPDTDEDGLPQFGSSAFVYEPYFLLLSYLALAGRTLILLPEDIQNIIERVYSEPEGPWPSAVFERAVSAARASMIEKTKRSEFQARVNLVPLHDSSDPLDFFSQFNKELEEDNPDVHRSLQALTRLAQPSVQVVCLCKSADGTFRREDDHCPLDMSQVPRGETVIDLLRRSLTITDKRVAFRLLDDQPPTMWKKCPALRHHRLLEFEDSVAKCDKYLLRLDRELGLCIEESGNEGESEE